MRVVHIYKDYDPPVHGGIEKHIATLGRSLTRRGVDVEVLCSRPPGAQSDEMDGAVRVRRCSRLATVASTPLAPALPFALRASAADVVHVHFPWPPGEAAWWLAARDRPLVVSVHCEVARYPRLAKLMDPLTQRMLSAARRIIVGSEALAGLPLLAEHRHRIEVIPYGIDLDCFHVAVDGEDPLPNVPQPRAVFVGRLRHYKGLSVLAEGLARLPDLHLVVVGDGPERESFKTQLAAVGALERVHFQGDVTESRLVTLLNSAEVAVLASTSRAEAFGLAIAEAQACGTPGVTTEVGTGTALTVDDGRSGRVIPPGDAEALAVAIEWCVAQEGRSDRRAAARQHAVSMFSADRMADDVMKVYRSANSLRS